MGNKQGGGVKPEFRKNSTVDKLSSNEEVGKDLRHVPLLSKYSDDELAKLGAVLEQKFYKSGENIFEQGNMGTGFFIISKGSVVVHRVDEAGARVELGKLKDHDYFGEVALLNNSVRLATVTATSDLICYYLDRKQFQQLFSGDSLNVQFAKRAGVSAEQTSKQQKEYQKPAGAVTDKSDSQRNLILHGVEQNTLFVALNAEQRNQVMNEMYRETVKAGTSIIKQGTQGDLFYVVESGAFDIKVNDAKVATRKAGESFGELALMYNAPRAATVTASEDSVVWVVHRVVYRRILASSTEARYAEYVTFLKSVALLAPLASYEREKIAEALEEVSFPANHTIFEQGATGDAMYIIRQGELVVIKDGDEAGKLGKGDYFGERALLKKDVRAATVATLSPTVCLKLDQESFTLLLGPLEDVMHKKIDTHYDVGSERQSRASTVNGGLSSAKIEPVKGKLDAGVRFEKLKTLGTLGRGSFGHVSLVQDVESGRTFALKAVNKAAIVETGQHQHIMSEKNTMAAMDHPFIIKLWQTFKDKDRLYFLLEPVLGGELFTLLRAMTLFDTNTARFYAASVVLVFEYMHSLDYIYRDLKPENILLNAQGYLKITDFGFAKKLITARTQTLCGTPDYLAPEIVSGKGHDKGVDWWTLGVLIYEMLASMPPFFDEDPMKIYAKIMSGEINFPPHFSKAAMSIVKKLLNQKSTRRLGIVKGGARKIKEHPWFEGFDWDGLFEKKVKAPIIPQIKNEMDLSNFDDVQDDEPEQIPAYYDDGRFPDWDADF